MQRSSSDGRRRAVLSDGSASPGSGPSRTEDSTVRLLRSTTAGTGGGRRERNGSETKGSASRKHTRNVGDSVTG